MVPNAAKIRILVCDDEPEARQGIADLLRKDPEVLLVAEATHGREAATAIHQLAPDVVFLDVQMPRLDGFGVLAELGGGTGQREPVIVFVTAYDEYALRAFDVHAVDYLLKPFSTLQDGTRLALSRGRRAAFEAAIGGRV